MTRGGKTHEKNPHHGAANNIISGHMTDGTTSTNTHNRNDSSSSSPKKEQSIPTTNTNAKATTNPNTHNANNIRPSPVSPVRAANLSTNQSNDRHVVTRD